MATTTESGLKFVVLRAGPACDNSPEGGDAAIVHYEGQLTDGTVFDSSFNRSQAASFPANRVISGWTEALGLMCPGDDWLVYLPSDIAYGEFGSPPVIPGNADLIFRVQLLAVVDEETWTGGL